MVVPVFLLSALASSRLFQSVHTPINPVQIQALSAIGPFDQLLMLVETAVAAPIVEELMFRGLLFPALRSRWGYVSGVVLTSAVFGLLHPNLPAGFLPLWTLGAAFAVVFQRRQSLLPCIVMHALHNGFVTVMMFMVFAK
jgi:membrane protease YdiL (CAAX protease family)